MLHYGVLTEIFYLRISKLFKVEGLEFKLCWDTQFPKTDRHCDCSRNAVYSGQPGTIPQKCLHFVLRRI